MRILRHRQFQARACCCVCALSYLYVADTHAPPATDEFATPACSRPRRRSPGPQRLLLPHPQGRTRWASRHEPLRAPQPPSACAARRAPPSRSQRTMLDHGHGRRRRRGGDSVDSIATSALSNQKSSAPANAGRPATLLTSALAPQRCSQSASAAKPYADAKCSAVFPRPFCALTSAP